MDKKGGTVKERRKSLLGSSKAIVLKDGSMFKSGEDVIPEEKKVDQRKKSSKSGFVISAPIENSMRHEAHVGQDLDWGEEGWKQFDLGIKLGQGAYGSVYKGVHIASGRVFAIKQCPTLGPSRDSIQKEIDILKKCADKNIVQYYGSAVKGKTLWIFMEFCGGGAVDDLMKKSEEKKLPEDIIAAVMAESVRGLIYLHSQKIIHRDIKAANILVDQDGNVKLADFGVSAQIKDEAEKKQTTTGTALWMSPEVLNGDAYDFRVDVWSLAITALEMAEGDPPYINEPMMKAMLKICTGDPPKLKEPEKWSKDFNDFLAYCLIKDPTARPSSTDLLNHPFIKNCIEPKKIIIQWLVTLGIIQPPEPAQKQKDEISKPTPKETSEDPAMMALKNLTKKLQEELKDERDRIKVLQAKLAEAESRSSGLSSSSGGHDSPRSVKISTDSAEVRLKSEAAAGPGLGSPKENGSKGGATDNGDGGKKGKKGKKSDKGGKKGGRKSTQTASSEMVKLPNLDEECKDLDRAGVLAKLKNLDAQYRALQANNVQANATIKLLLDQIRETKK